MAGRGLVKDGYDLGQTKDLGDDVVAQVMFGTDGRVHLVLLTKLGDFRVPFEKASATQLGMLLVKAGNALPAVKG